MRPIEVHDLRKAYGQVRAVDGISFEIDRGEVVALLGPNGAGKTTVVEIIEGHRTADSGTVRVLGHDPARRERALRERIGIVLQEAGFDEDATVAELVRLHRDLYPRRLDAAAVIELVGLTAKRSARVRTLSGGQRRRLDLALGLVGDPEVLFLDEPTVGFDPEARRQAWSIVRDLRATGTTILLTTHYLDEAQHLADRVAVVVAGRLVALGPPAELAARGRSTVIEFRSAEGADVTTLPDALGDGARVERDGAGWRVTTEDTTRALHAMTGWSIEHRVPLDAIEVRRPTLEDAYLTLVGERAVHAGADEAVPT
ncbi:ABC transporter ATP-binding protein [Agromyces aurantiacus]|uniref:ABC transporter ATP-binding protein n=1 Tax=Agromyces aurantiacus TaxID=165814 RepID=A0ABV9R3T8_9MICO|nr:ABC transporter ATP-binding protein [Agromyces aurantiacus]MBM7503334.1 ABC-2 type transport system ATP-binding protein [Agromyces aurantiacus]